MLISCYVSMLTRLSVRALSCAVVVAAGLLSSAAARDRLDWVPYFNERFGFSFRYPAGVFAPERGQSAETGKYLSLQAVRHDYLWVPSRTSTATLLRAT